MMHVAMQVVGAIKDILNAGSLTNYRHAYASRVIDPRMPLPFLSVFTDGEDISPQSVHPGHVQDRTIGIQIVGRLRVIDDLEQMDKDLSALQSEVESLVTTTVVRSVLPKVKSVLLLTVEHAITEDDNDKVFAELTLNLQVRVITTEGSPDTFL